MISAMRNEGPFLVEWVAWQRMLGFTDILVLTNDCSDGTDAMADVLDAAGWITHLRHCPAPGEPPKRSAHRAARAHPLVARAGWAMVLDVDEFLVVHRGAGTVQDLADLPDPAFAGLAVHWKCFGSGGRALWEDGLVHRQYLTAACTADPVNASFKSLFRDPLRYRSFGAHSPKDAPDWGHPGDRWVTSSGSPLPRYHPNANPQKATAPGRVTHAAAQVNHYVTRTPEEFALKHGTPSASALRDRYTGDFFVRHDRNEVLDDSALSFRDRFQPIHAEAMALPSLLRLHHLACVERIRRLAHAAHADPEADPRLAFHRGLAEAN